MVSIFTSSMDPTINILVINPNSSKEMTMGLDKLISTLQYPKETRIQTYTAPSGPDSINNEEDAELSAKIVLADLLEGKINNYSAFLVCCYSVHPLIPMLRAHVPSSVPVIGIFEASVSSSLSLLQSTPDGKFGAFGIVSTGKYWEAVLSEGVFDYLGVDGEGVEGRSSRKFNGVETTGLTAGELHSVPAVEVEAKMIAATRRLVRGAGVKAVCLGCAGMAGMDVMVRRACVLELGEVDGGAVHIIDGVKAGIAILDGLIRSKTIG